MIERELLQCSYWEHHKFAKDLALILPIDHPKRVRIEKELNKIIAELKVLEDERDNGKL